MGNGGWVKLWRKSFDSAVWSDPDLWRLWTCCLMLANHKEGWFKADGLAKPIKVLPGQFVTGRESLHQTMYPKKRKANPAPYTVWRWLFVLQDLGNLSIKSSNKYTMVTIVNWDSYQHEEAESVQQNEQQVSSRRAADVQQVSTNKNEKNEKKKDNVIVPLPGNGPPCCPHQEIITLYHEVLPELPRVQVWNDKRKAALRARWSEDKQRQSLDWWRKYFDIVKRSPFLLGRKSDFRASLEWLVLPKNFPKVLEGNYVEDVNTQEAGSTVTGMSWEEYEEAKARGLM